MIDMGSEDVYPVRQPSGKHMMSTPIFDAPDMYPFILDRLSESIPGEFSICTIATLVSFIFRAFL